MNKQAYEASVRMVLEKKASPVSPDQAAAVADFQKLRNNFPASRVMGNLSAGQRASLINGLTGGPITPGGLLAYNNIKANAPAVQSGYVKPTWFNRFLSNPGYTIGQSLKTLGNNIYQKFSPPREVPTAPTPKLELPEGWNK